MTAGGRRPSAVNNWGRWGADDELGTLNELTPEVVRGAAATIRTGERYPLNLPVDLPRSRSHGRPEFEKVAFRRNAEVYGLVANDDYVVLALQGSSQWDAFVHCGVREPDVDGVFYNGIDTDAVDEQGFAHRGGIDKVAQRGIVGRGVLVDVARYITGSPTEALAGDVEIDEAMVRATIDAQGVGFEPGDIVCLRTGWTDAYVAADEGGRAALTSTTPRRVSAGVSPALATYAHQQRWAALAADNPAVEQTPMKFGSESAHTTLLRNLGLPLGELLWFGPLADACAADGRYDFFFVSVPLWVPGGMGSPANAIAIR